MASEKLPVVTFTAEHYMDFLRTSLSTFSVKTFLRQFVVCHLTNSKQSNIKIRGKTILILPLKFPSKIRWKVVKYYEMTLVQQALLNISKDIIERHFLELFATSSLKEKSQKDEN